MRIVTVRHALTGYNAERRLQGSLDVPLGSDGRAQAVMVADALLTEYGTGLSVVTSPLSRASQTADAIAQLAGVAAIPDVRLTQRPYGAWEGLTWDEVREQWPAEYARRHEGLDPAIPGWGASDEVGERVAAALVTCAERAEADDVVVAVSHGSAIMLGVATLLGLPLVPSRLGHLPHGAWNELTWVRGGQWRLTRYCVGGD
jgi:probable phosphoglycerate mutase